MRKTDQFPKSEKDFIELLMILVFERAKKESKKDRKQHLAQYLNEVVKIGINDRNLIRYYDGYILGVSRYRTTPRQYNLDELSKFLGFDDFAHFCAQKDEDLEVGILILARIKAEQKMRRKMKSCMIITLVVSVAMVFYASRFYEKKCMVWVDDHFEKTRCSGLELEEPLEPMRLAHFRKVEVCKDSIFFKDGEPIKFYLRHGGGIEFFTYPGEHPIYNGSHLDPVSEDIYESWVPPCDAKP